MTDEKCVSLAVCGLHMRGLALNHQLTDLGASYQESIFTAPGYRMKLIEGTIEKPFLSACEDGYSFEVEIWKIPVSRLGEFLIGIPAPLALGKIRLSDGREVTGFIGQAGYEQKLKDISEYGGWKNYTGQNTA